MKQTDIHIRDPFIFAEDGTYYLYGTRGADFGQKVGGVDVYTSRDLAEWSEPHECLNTETLGLNKLVNWAPEVHKYRGGYYMFITLTAENGLKGTHILKADSPLGPFLPHSDGAVTPHDWEALDGTLLVQDDVPYIVFCHEHVQIIDGTVCFARLSDDLKERIDEPTTVFAASDCPYVDPYKNSGHYVTDGPFFYRTKEGALLMIWSSFIQGNYAELQVRFKDGRLGKDYAHLPPLLENDSGHGMIFSAEGKLYLTYHFPNTKGGERPHFVEIEDKGDSLEVKK